MTTEFTLPAAIEDARVELATLEQIAQATGWRRAAIVWAFVEPAEQGWPRSSKTRSHMGSSARMSARDFAALGIAGLRSHHTVSHYHGAWAAAIEAGEAEPVAPGDTVTLPDMPFPPNPTVGRNLGHADREALTVQAAVDGVGPSKVLDVASNPKAIAAAIKASPAVAAEARRAIRDRDRIERMTDEAHVAAAAGDVGRRLGKALGCDEATSHLHQATAEVAAAGQERELHGLTNPEEWAEALDVLRRYVDALSGGTPGWTDQDRSFLASLGVDT